MFLLPLEPMPCPRPRIALRGKYPVAYYPSAYTKWKEEAAHLLAQYPHGEVFTNCGLRVEAHFYARRPRTSKLNAPKPDIDNYLKSLLDALTQASWWVDDSQVWEVRAYKAWADTGVTPHIAFDVQPIRPS